MNYCTLLAVLFPCLASFHTPLFLTHPIPFIQSFPPLCPFVLHPRTGNVLVAAMEEASLGLEPHVVVARASLLSGLSQCVMRYALAHISANLARSTRYSA